jgi:hypothetical protein
LSEFRREPRSTAPTASTPMISAIKTAKIPQLGEIDFARIA